MNEDFEIMTRNIIRKISCLLSVFLFVFCGLKISAKAVEDEQDWRKKYEAEPAGCAIRYPKKLDLSPLKPLKMKEYSRNLDSTKEEIANGIFRYDIPDFFNKNEKLTINEISEDHRCCSVILRRENNYTVEFNFDKFCLKYDAFRWFPVQTYDFDGNGLTDIKMLGRLDGNSGNMNVAMVYYFYQLPDEWRMIGFFLRDPLYSWECDLDGDGVYELLKGHHQDKYQQGYPAPKTGKWVADKFRKYLFINAYKPGPDGLVLCNELSKSLPMVLNFYETDPFDIRNDKDFMKFNQFSIPEDYVFEIRKIPTAKETKK